MALSSSETADVEDNRALLHEPGLRRCLCSEATGWLMFKRRRFPVEIILVCIRWYCKYGVSYRDLTEMMRERGGGGRPVHDHALGPSIRA